MLYLPQATMTEIDETLHRTEELANKKLKALNVEKASLGNNADVTTTAHLHAIAERKGYFRGYLHATQAMTSYLASAKFTNVC